MKKRILVLDDSPFMLTVTSDMLKKLSYDVTAVDNPQEACREVEATRYDMIITDLNMPVMDGLEFTRQVKENPNYRFVPIVMLSSEGNDEKIAKAKKMGVSTFLSKPLKEAQLKTLLQITLSKRKSPRIPAKLEISYGREENLTEYSTGYTFNVSLGGLFLETSNPLPLKEKLKLKFTLSETSPPVVCRGQVAWVNSPVSPCNPTHPTGVGVEFFDLEDERRLQEFLKSGVWKS